VLGSLNALAMVLAGRLVALLAVAAATALTWVTLAAGDLSLLRMTVLAIFCVSVALPALVLAFWPQFASHR
jgi:hypothetical protein